MTPIEALNILARAASEYRGTAQEHAIIAQAVQMLLPIVREQQPSEAKDTVAQSPETA